MGATMTRSGSHTRRSFSPTQSNPCGSFFPFLCSYPNSYCAHSAILEAMSQLDLALAPQNDARRTTILSMPAQIEADTMPRDVADAIRSLWRDPAVQEAVRRAREFQLNDSAVYY